MALTVSSKIFGHDPGEGSANEFDLRTYTVIYEIDQTDAGPMADGVAVGIAAQQLMSGDPLPLLGDNYVFSNGSGTVTDLDAYALKFSWKRPFPKEYRKRWHFTVEFGPPPDDPANVGVNDPLLLATEYWVDWTEEQVPLAEAKVITSLDHVGRASGTTGPIVNAAGQEFSDPAMKTVYYPLLSCRRPYEDLADIVALNNAYQETMNSDTFFGSPPRTAKYLTTESGQIQRAGGISFYFGVTKIWFKEATWDRFFLNNGWCHLEPNPKPPPMLKLVNNLVFAHPDDEKRTERPSEPCNLNGVGGYMPVDVPAIFIQYRHLREVAYAGIGVGGS